ncbi:MAG: outer membrane protein assembly factor BamD [Nitrospira sp.]|nr:MAG: outer membrane protein assembly factor BamD [Nitrospira sp.]
MRMIYRTFFLPLSALSLALAIAAAGCSSASKPAPAQGKALSGIDEQIFIGDSIEKNYDPNVIMKRAEAFFEKEEFPEAIIEYQHFMDLHRAHVLAPYALFKLGESHFKMMKTVDRDPDPVNKAMLAYEKLLKEYPGSKWEADAIERVKHCHENIAQARMFVGKFYYRREAYLAAAHRFESVIKSYPDLAVSGDALYNLALTYQDLGATDWAQEKLALLLERFPNNTNADEGRALLISLSGGKRTGGSSAVASLNGAAPSAVSTGGNGTVSIGSPLPDGSAALQDGTAASKQSTLCRLGIWC